MSGVPSSLPQAGPRIGPYELDSPFVLAALSGYSDAAMRRLSREYGASYALAEVMIERFAVEVKQTGKTKHHFHVDDDDHPVAGQLMGSDVERFGPAALRLVEAGFDVIDINFGCPVKSAIGGCRGGYHLGRPDVALDIVRRVRDVVPSEIPVTVKMRRGIDDTSESRDKFFTILDGAFELGVAAITVHGRTVEQKYVGPSRWEFLKELKQHAGERVILGSGDLFTAEDCIRMIQETGVDGVTIARGAIGNPWIFQQCLALWNGELAIPSPTVLEQRHGIMRHAEMLKELYGPDRWVRKMCQFNFKYAPLHPEHETVRNAFATLRTDEQWQAVMDQFYPVDGANSRS
ncbi:MAG: tRNA-dihydrouridine synthase [Planctomycetaceae bacterium]